MNKSLQPLPPDCSIDSVVLDCGRIEASPAFLEILNENNFTTFQAVIDHPSLNFIRSVPGRSTVRLELKGQGGEMVAAYLKRYQRKYLTAGKFLRRLFRFPGGEDEAIREWRMMHKMRACGINTAMPIAVGQSRNFGVVTRSFVIAAEITDGVPADDYLRQISPERRRELALQIAEFARRFHQAGFIHKDFYLCHIFVVAKDDTWELYVIDLQRALGPGKFLRRWLLKDLSAIAFSAQNAGISRAVLLHCYKRYFQKQRLAAEDRTLIRAIAARVARLRRHRPKYEGVWDEDRARQRIP